MVRHLQPTDTGIPIELYCFSSNKVWVEYEGIQADIFDHVLAVIPEFGLSVFQNVSGADLKNIINTLRCQKNILGASADDPKILRQ